jgi:hypothetical protein
MKRTVHKEAAVTKLSISQNNVSYNAEHFITKHKYKQIMNQNNFLKCLQKITKYGLSFLASNLICNLYFSIIHQLGINEEHIGFHAFLFTF